MGKVDEALAQQDVVRMSDEELRRESHLVKRRYHDVSEVMDKTTTRMMAIGFEIMRRQGGEAARSAGIAAARATDEAVEKLRDPSKNRPGDPDVS